MQVKWLTGALVRVAISVLFAGLLYTGWLAVFLGVLKNSQGPVMVVWWIMAPIVTATGFAAGMVIAHRLLAGRRDTFFRALVWPLAGCVLGAVAVVWFGPMLIVFGMFLVGTGSVVLREFVLLNGRGIE